MADMLTPPVEPTSNKWPYIIGLVVIAIIIGVGVWCYQQVQSISTVASPTTSTTAKATTTKPAVSITSVSPSMSASTTISASPAVSGSPTNLLINTTYKSSKYGFSVDYPNDYTLNENYSNDSIVTGVTFSGVQFKIPTSFATGTNMNSNTTEVSIEQKTGVAACTANEFLNTTNTLTTITDQGVEYSVGTLSEGAAGSAYEQKVFALTKSSPCLAVRYFIQSGNIGNYPAEAGIIEFNKAALTNAFDTIRRSLTITK